MNKPFLSASDIADILEISTPNAYKIIAKLNKELDDMGYLFVTGKVNKTYFEERFYIKPEFNITT